MKLSSSILYASLAAVAAAAPANRSSKTTCEQWGKFESDKYTIYNDLWARPTALEVSVFRWKLRGVKSYANAAANFEDTQISNIKSIKAKWKWSYSGTSFTANVAWDMFTSSTGGDSKEYEIMVWAAALGGAGPISSSYSATGAAQPLANTTIEGCNFCVYKGSNGAQTVFSFVPSKTLTSYSPNLLKFFSYLISSQGFSTSQYLVDIGAGTEAFTGTDAVFKTISYSVDIVTGSG